MMDGNVSGPAALPCLRRAPLLSGVAEPALLALARACQIRRVSKGSLVFLQGDEADAAYVVCSGSVTIVLMSADGRELVINEMRPGDWFGELALLTGRPHSAGAMARIESEVLAVPRQAFDGLLAAHPNLAKRMLDMTAERLVSSSEREGALAFLDAQARVARMLVHLDEHSLAEGYVTVSQEELAQRTGLTRQTVAGILSRWRRHGWVVTGRGRIMLLNHSPLERLAERGLD